MRATDIVTPMLLLTEQEKREAEAQFSQGYRCKQQGDEAGAVFHYTAAAKLGHPAALNNLAVQYQNGAGVQRNAQVAFQLFLEAARHGNTVAQRNVGWYYRSGTGTETDQETGIAWTELAAANGDIIACKNLAGLYHAQGDQEKETAWHRRAAELGDENSKQWLESRAPQGDPEYLRRLSLPMPPANHSDLIMANHSEYYSGGYYRQTAAVYEGKLYYLCTGSIGSAVLCVSELDGSDAQVMARLEGYGGAGLAVNCVGAFVYITRYENGRIILYIKEFDLNGLEVYEHKLAAEDYTEGSLYFHFNIIYYIVEKKGKCQLCAYNVSSRSSQVIYDKASSIDHVYAWRSRVVFYATYEKSGQSEWGWMLYDPDTRQIWCLDSSLSHELVLTHPEYFDWEGPSYVEVEQQRKIFSFDMARGIVWTKRDAKEGGKSVVYLEPRPVDGAWTELVPDVPIWRFDYEDWSKVSSGLVYFDGDKMYRAPDYYHFYGCDRTGKVCHWDMSHGHGCCDQFVVSGDRLLLDVDAFGEKVYPAAVEPSAALGESWRLTPPPKEKEIPDPFGPTDWQELERGLERKFGKPKQVPPVVSQGDMTTEKTLTATDVKYGILTFGSKFHIGAGVPVTVAYQGCTYHGKTHNTSKGRVDGIKKLFTEHNLVQGQVFQARYVEAEQTIYLS